MTTELMLGISLEIWGVIIFIACILVATQQFHIFADRNKYLVILFALNAITLALDAFGRCYNVGVVGILPPWLVRGLYFLVFELGYLLSLFFLLYVGTLIREQHTSYQIAYIYAEGFIVLCGTVLLTMTQFNDFYYYFDDDMKYHRQEAFSISMLLGVAGVMLSAAMIIQYRQLFRKNDRRALYVYIILPLIALIAQTRYAGISLLNIATTASLLFIFIAHEIEISKMLREKQELLYQKEKEESNRRYELLHSQIEPHFLFNSLSSICAMCEDPNAVEVLQNFAKYLRRNMEAIDCDDNIPFSKEIEHVQAYLSIELLRFEERLNVVFDVEESDFILPPLALETLVENAVKHGISMKRTGGTIRITSKLIESEVGKYYAVVVEDDGVGFDLEEVKSDGKSHIGIWNVKQRLEERCGGQLIIESEKGKGTKVTLLLPESFTPIGQTEEKML